MRILSVATAIVLCSTRAFSQPAEASPKFDVADVHVSAATFNSGFRGGILRGGRYEVRNATVLDLIKLAYNVDADQVGRRPPWADADRGDKVIGGPSWLDADRFDIIARSPVSTPPETVRAMLRALLVDRFDLAVHQAEKPFLVYALKSGPQLRIKKSAGSDSTGCRRDPPNASADDPEHAIVCRNVSMASVVAFLPNIATQYFDHPLVDKTGLEGTWDFDLRWSDRGAPGSSGISVFNAIEKQLGLKLELQKVPLAVIAVDHVNRRPTENSPGALQSLSEGSAAFEVADVKPSAPDSTLRGFRSQPGGRVTVQGVTLMRLIEVAWDEPQEMIVGAPKWLDNDRFDIIAKAPAEAAPAGQALDFEALRPMIRSLLTDRFKLVTHNEVQPVPVYALTSRKGEPRLKKADLTVRSECRFAPLPPGAGINSPLTSGYVCQNTTMAQLAEKIRGWAGTYITRTVVDLTGIAGGWDFVLRWTPARNVPGLAGRGGDPQPPGALGPSTDPTSGVTVFEAIDRQLGLKLEVQKHPMPVLVIDHVEQKPTEN